MFSLLKISTFFSKFTQLTFYKTFTELQDPCQCRYGLVYVLHSTHVVILLLVFDSVHIRTAPERGKDALSVSSTFQHSVHNRIKPDNLLTVNDFLRNRVQLLDERP